jgi:hypothetical protein
LAALRTCRLTAAAEELGEGETSIVVTGTLIKGSREDAPRPVDVIDAEISPRRARRRCSS